VFSCKKEIDLPAAGKANNNKFFASGNSLLLRNLSVAKAKKYILKQDSEQEFAVSGSAFVLGSKTVMSRLWLKEAMQDGIAVRWFEMALM